MVCTYRTIAPGARQAAATYAAYLLEQTLTSRDTATAAYYLHGQRPDPAGVACGQSIPRVREDLETGLARALALAPGATLDTAALGHLLAGRRADGREIALAGHHNVRVRHYEDAEGRVVRSRVAAMDLTFSAPKSFSVAWALAATEAERWSLMACHRAAVDEALRYVEGILGVGYLGAARGGGQERAHLAWATVDHYTARPTLEIIRPDPVTGVTGTELYPVRDRDVLAGMPQVHTHALAPNLMRTESGRLVAVNRDLLDGRVHEIGAVYHMLLARNLRAIGVAVDLDPDTLTACLPAIDRAVCDAFSPRTGNGTEAAIEHALAQGLIARREDWDLLSPDQRIALVKTGVQGHKLPKAFGLEAQREHAAAPRKDHVADVRFWRGVAERIGFRHETVITPGPPAPVPDAAAREAAGWEVAAGLIEAEWNRRAVLTVADLRLAAARALIAAGGQAVGDVDRVVERLARDGMRQQGRWTGLLAPRGTGDATARVTTTLHRDQERELIHLLRDLAGRPGFALAPAALRRAVAAVDASTVIGQEQRRAIEVVGAGGAVSVFIGVGGSGKTTRVLAGLVQAYQAGGREVWGTALARRQADALQEAGVDAARTLALDPLLAGLREGAERPVAIRPGSVLLLDEFSQVGTRQLLELVRAAARGGFKLALTGDERQMQSIEAGAIIDLLAAALGREAIPEILTIMRQACAREREIAALFRGRRGDGPESRLRDVARAIDLKREDGSAELVHGSRSDVLAFAAREVVAAQRAAAARGLTVTAAAPTNHDAREIGLAIRTLRQGAGEVGRDAVLVAAGNREGECYDMALAAGDRIRLYQRTHGRFPRPDGREVAAVVGNNGTVLTVLEVVAERVHLGRRVVHRAGLRVRTPAGKLAFVGWDALRLHGTNRVAIAYGDCLTIASSQGLTSDEHFALLPGGSRNVTGWEAYVALSRHRQRCRLLVGAAAELRQVDELRPGGQPVPADWAEREREAWDNLVANLARQPVKETARQLLEGALSGRRQSIRALQRHLRATEARERAGLAPTTLRETLNRTQAARQLVLALGAVAGEVREATRAAPRPLDAGLEGGVRDAAPLPLPQPPPRPVAPGPGDVRPRPARPRRRVEIGEAEARQQFADALRAAGLKLDGLPIMDGQRHYAPVQGNRGRQKSGAYMGFADGVPNGIIWNYKAGTRSTWRASGGTVPVSPAEARRFAAQAARAQAASRAAQQAREDAAAQRTAWLLEGTRPATPGNAYLRRKGVTEVPPGLREDLRGNLVIPLSDPAGTLRNMQIILARPPRDGSDKLYQEGAQKTGTGFRIGTPRPGQPLGLAEGFATAWSAHRASGLAVVVALDTSNLLPLAAAIRRAEPDRPLVFFADNDHHLPARQPPLPNAGLEKANAAADAVGKAVVVAPPLDPARHAQGRGTDWNDHHQKHGLAATAVRIAAALRVGAPAAVAGPVPAREMPDGPAEAPRARPDHGPQGEPPMTDRKIHKARVEVRQERQREVDVWQDREQAGRAAREADGQRRQGQGMGAAEEAARPRAGARQNQAPGA